MFGSWTTYGWRLKAREWELKRKWEKKERSGRKGVSVTIEEKKFHRSLVSRLGNQTSSVLSEILRKSSTQRNERFYNGSFWFQWSDL